MGKTQKTEQSDPLNYLVQTELGKLYQDIGRSKYKIKPRSFILLTVKARHWAALAVV